MNFPKRTQNIDMPKQVYSSIELDRLKRHEFTINRMGYLIVALSAFASDFFFSQINYQSLIRLVFLCIIMVTIVVVFNQIRSPDERLQERIFFKLSLFVLFISIIMIVAGSGSRPLYSLFYLIFISSLLSLNKKQLRAILVFISLAIILVSSFHGETITQSLRYLIYQLIPFWIVAFIALEIFMQTDEAKNQLARLSNTDTLTGLWNMRSFMESFRQEIVRSRRYNHAFVVIMIDSDNLKTINDKYGHIQGSNLIKLTATILQTSVRETDIIARYGGDEFILLLPETSKRSGEMVAERIRQNINKSKLDVGTGKVDVSVSIGLCCFPLDGNNEIILIAAADLALYESKKAGKNRVTCFTRERISDGDLDKKVSWIRDSISENK